MSSVCQIYAQRVSDLEVNVFRMKLARDSEWQAGQVWSLGPSKSRGGQFWNLKYLRIFFVLRNFQGFTILRIVKHRGNIEMLLERKEGRN